MAADDFAPTLLWGRKASLPRREQTLPRLVLAATAGLARMLAPSTSASLLWTHSASPCLPNTKATSDVGCLAGGGPSAPLDTGECQAGCPHSRLPLSSQRGLVMCASYVFPEIHEYKDSFKQEGKPLK